MVGALLSRDSFVDGRGEDETDLIKSRYVNWPGRYTAPRLIYPVYDSIDAPITVTRGRNSLQQRRVYATQGSKETYSSSCRTLFIPKKKKKTEKWGSAGSFVEYYRCRHLSEQLPWRQSRNDRDLLGTRKGAEIPEYRCRENPCIGQN
ncbi:hypothetical protein WN55_08094 [Dufourea novaeangliae]|uniref:Uncharacterized protein n=1 Tax=Dufourea novaeangliae TaxID=178035 RepID=A0A154P7C7_DUFNO|nr:hypothetical protein WN55_08094 [Dufourea novaeangliae]